MHEPDVALPDPQLPARTLRKVAWRLIPFLILLYIFNIIDRANVGFARARLREDLALSDAVFDFGYGIFYLGYLAFEVPSNLLLHRVGARRWIARITITWGLVSCATAFVTGPWSFYAVRILLGVAEAGFFPGIILYLTYWFPARERARIIALFMTAIAFAGVVSNPLSGAILEYLEGVQGLKGWQWIFLLEGLPPILLGFAVLVFLKDRPAEATWLTFEQRAWLCERMSREEHARQQRHGADFLRALVDARVWLLIGLYSTVAITANAAGAHVPQRIRNHFPGERELVIGLLSALPHLCAIVGMTLLGAHSDRTGERIKHFALAAFTAAVGWSLSAAAEPSGLELASEDRRWLALAGFCLAQMGMMSMLPVFWAIPTSFLSGAAAAGGIALINSVANIGGWFGPNILGAWGLWSMAGTLAAGGMAALGVSKAMHTDAEPRDSKPRPSA